MRLIDPFYGSPEWMSIRRKVLKRDNYRCVNCNAWVKGKGKARVDHIKTRKEFPELSLDMNNLRTLCTTCDNRRHIYERCPNKVPRHPVNELGYTKEWE